MLHSLTIDNKPRVIRLCIVSRGARLRTFAHASMRHSINILKDLSPHQVKLQQLGSQPDCGGEVAAFGLALSHIEID